MSPLAQVLKFGDVVLGTVVAVEPTVVAIDLESGDRGLLDNSQLSYHPVADMRENLKVGDVLKVGTNAKRTACFDISTPVEV